MKLTRMFILKAFDEDCKNYNNEDPVNSLKKLIITNSNIDILINLILSLLYIISIGFINNNFYDVYPINFIIFGKLTIALSFILLFVEFLRITIITWEKYLRSLNKPQNISERSSIQSNKSNHSQKSKNSLYSFGQKIEMDNLDDKKSPFLPENEKKEEEKNNKGKNNFGSSKNYIFNEGNKFNIINNKKDYIEVYYESILSSPENTFYDKIFIKIYIILIKKVNKLIGEENDTDINNKNKKKSLYKMIIKYPHTISSIFHLIKNISFLLSFGLSFAFWILYSSLRPELRNYSFNIINIFLGECLELYALFRLCFFFIKIILNFVLSPLYISAIYLGYYEDKFNVKLNDLIKTRFYTGKQCLISRNSINKVKESEIDDSCAICLSIYMNGDVISTLPCSKRHSFHTYCLEEWFHTNVCCPLCRCDFSSEIGIYLPNQQNANNNANENNQNNEDGFEFIIPNNLLNFNFFQDNNNNANNDNINNNIINENINNGDNNNINNVYEINNNIINNPNEVNNNNINNANVDNNNNVQNGNRQNVEMVDMNNNNNGNEGNNNNPFNRNN